LDGAIDTARLVSREGDSLMFYGLNMNYAVDHGINHCEPGVCHFSVKKKKKEKRKIFFFIFKRSLSQSF
jgi:hypothetical protein